MNEDDFVPIEKLNTRVRVYQKPTVRERATGLFDSAKKGFFKTKATVEDLKERTAPMREKLRASQEVRRQQSQGFIKGMGNRALENLDARSRSQSGGNVFTQTSTPNPYFSYSKPGNNPYSFGRGSSNVYYFASAQAPRAKKVKRKRIVIYE